MLDITNMESYLISTSMDDGTTATSYVFELIDKENEEKKQQRRKKYQIGVGQNDASSTLRRGKVRTTTAMSSSSSASTAPSTRHAAVRSTRSCLSEISVGETTADESRNAFAHEVRCLGGFTKNKAQIKRTATAVSALRYLHDYLGWTGSKRPSALGLFGQLHADLPAMRKEAGRLCRRFDERFPDASL